VTLELLRELIGWVLVAGGGIFVIIGALGLNRMPDFFTRLHATSVGDTFGAGLMLTGMMIEAGLSLVTLKLLFLLLFLWFAGPVATHALARAALIAGVKPVLSPDSPVDADLKDARQGEPSSNR
jgi:multicomponent Na+:H+ antiporter subunit G